MKRILVVVCLSGLMLTSCDSSSSKDDTVFDSSIVPKTSAIPVVAVDSQNQAAPVIANQPVQVNPQQQAAPVSVNGSTVIQTAPASKTVPATTPVVTQQPTATATTTTAPGMNPPHGQPGHRCDIYVGAPLNSKPNPQATAAQQPVVTQQPVTPVTAPGMNPPHGQPNHRCDIAVGAPLNSAPPVVKKDSTVQQ